MRQLSLTPVVWPARGTFRISRSALTEIPVVHVTITEGEHTGRGECRPYGRYGESVETVSAQIETIRAVIERGLSLTDLQAALPAGAARNAVDCALWDLAAKQKRRRVWELLELPAPRPRTTAFTLSVDTPENMARAAENAARYPLLKMKLGLNDGPACIEAVAQARPDADLIIDANEALSPEALTALQKQLRSTRTVLIEQPLPADSPACFDPGLTPPICADEALHTSDDLDRLWAAGYRAVNVKLDKCGGLTEGLALMQAAKAKGFMIMAGCMVSSSLAMAPMMMLEAFADVIDLDGPLLLAADAANGLTYEGAVVHPPSRALWG